MRSKKYSPCYERKKKGGIKINFPSIMMQSFFRQKSPAILGEQQQQLQKLFKFERLMNKNKEVNKKIKSNSTKRK